MSENFADTLNCTECGETGHIEILTEESHVRQGKTIKVENIPTYKCKHCKALSYSSEAVSYVIAQLKK
jgi:YgiT-type zinc finger domain-containing protein